MTIVYTVIARSRKTSNEYALTHSDKWTPAYVALNGYNWKKFDLKDEAQLAADAIKKTDLFKDFDINVEDYYT